MQPEPLRFFLSSLLTVACLSGPLCYHVRGIEPEDGIELPAVGETARSAPAIPASRRIDERMASFDHLATRFLAKHKAPGMAVAD